MKWIPIALLLSLPMRGAELKPKTVEAFDRYMQQTAARLNAARTFLWADESPERARRVRQGEIVVQPFTAQPDIAVSGGLIHDWVGSAFIPGATLEKTLAMAQDYNRHKDIYKPEVIESRLLSRNGNEFHIFMRLLKKKVITVVLNTEHDVKYSPVDRTRWRSFSRTTKIAEVD